MYSNSATQRILTLGQVIKSAVIIAHDEDTNNLEQFFEGCGLPYRRQTVEYDNEEKVYPSIVKCFLNHRLAWQKIATGSRDDDWTLIVEADFVPIVGLLRQDVFWPINADLTYGYLYQNSPRIIALQGGYIRAHSAGCVAYVIDNRMARLLLDFFKDEQLKRQFTKYFTFDVHLQWFCMSRGAKAFISYKQLGEHGGLVSQGHIDAKISRKGRHRADRLAGPLAFRPLYSSSSFLGGVKERIFGYNIGVARLLAGRWTTDTSEHTWTIGERLRANLLICGRLFF